MKYGQVLSRGLEFSPGFLGGNLEFLPKDAYRGGPKFPLQSSYRGGT